MKKLIILIGIVVLLASLVVVKVFQDEKNLIAGIQIENVDIEHMQDGTYEGHYKTSLINVSVAVRVTSGRIDAIEIIHHSNGKGKDAENIVNDIIENNSLKVDVISGATASSMVIRKAVEQAFLKGGN